MTSVPHPQADEGGRSQALRLRERAAYPQLGWFPSFVEVDGPRHASCETVSPSNLVRPLFLLAFPLYASHCKTSNLRETCAPFIPALNPTGDFVGLYRGAQRAE